MDTNALIRMWKEEENIAHIHGWDFSHIDGRCMEEPLPWDYRQVIGEYLTPEMRLLDIDTGGGEFLLSLNHPHGNTAATENYPPNVELCKEILLPLGIDFRPADGKGNLPFENDRFDIVINRHGDLNPCEIYRVLKPGGIFLRPTGGRRKMTGSWWTCFVGNCLCLSLSNMQIRLQKHSKRRGL